MRLVDARREIRKVALEDALQRDGEARWDLVLDRMTARFPEIRAGTREIQIQVRLVVSEVNALDRDAQRAELAELNPAYDGRSGAELLD